MDSENSIAKNLDELGTLVSDQATAMLAYWDKDLICRFANNAYRDWFGRTKQEMINKMHISELLGPLYEKNLPYIQGVLNGKKQIFEREIPIEGQISPRYSLATYIPHLINKEVIGFFVHVADITHTKNLEKTIADSKKEILRNIIQTQEQERLQLVGLLRENINQKLVACKILLESSKENYTESVLEVNTYISDVVNEINKICSDLSPTEIELFGFIPALEIKIDHFAKFYSQVIEFLCKDFELEELSHKDKLSIYRIIQNLLQALQRVDRTTSITMEITCKQQEVKICLKTSRNFRLHRYPKEYEEIKYRVEFYNGMIHEKQFDNYNVLSIEFGVHKS